MAKRIRVLLVEPGREPVVAFIENSLPGLQAAIGGGYIQDVPLLEAGRGLSLICDEDGESKGQPLNRQVPGLVGEGVRGIFLIARSWEGDYISLTNDDVPELLTFMRRCLAYFKL